MGPRKKIRLDSEPVNEETEIIELKEKINMITNMDPNDVTKFTDLPISQYTIKGLTETQFIEPTKVQRQTLVHSLCGKDVVAASKTGSGKTLAFIIPMLENLYRNQWSSDDGIGALVITPTRELAYQLFELLNIVGKYHSLSAGLIIGGKDLKREWGMVGSMNIVICTPGRIVQHMTENSQFNVDNVQVLILDEADECLSMGFDKDMKLIFNELPKSRQTLLFSATQTKNIRDLSLAGCKDAVMCFAHEHSKSITPKKLVQAYYVCKLQDKIAFLWTFIKDHSCEKLLVFVQTCKQARYYTTLFSKMNRKIKFLMLHGGMNQMLRISIYDEYCMTGRAVMIATDVAARGLDFPSVHWVVQLDCPDTAKVYIHRAGRTARFDDDGRTVLVVTPMQKEPMLAEIAAHNIKIQEVEEYPSIFININKKIANFVAHNTDLSEQAERTFLCYLKAMSKMKTDFCDLPSIDFDAFARSLGLAKTPNINFLKRKMLSLQNRNEMKKSAAGVPISDEGYDLEDDQDCDITATIEELLITSDQLTIEMAPVLKQSNDNIVPKYSSAENTIQFDTNMISDDDNPVGDENDQIKVDEEISKVIDYSYFKDKANRKIDRKERKK